MEYKDPARYIPLYTYYVLGVPSLGFPVEFLYPRSVFLHHTGTESARVAVILATLLGSKGLGSVLRV